MCRNIKTLYNFDPPAKRGRGAVRRVAIRPQDQRLHQTLEGKRGGLRARSRRRRPRSRRSCSTNSSTSAPVKGPRGRGQQRRQPGQNSASRHRGSGLVAGSELGCGSHGWSGSSSSAQPATPAGWSPSSWSARGQRPLLAPAIGGGSRHWPLSSVASSRRSPTSPARQRCRAGRAGDVLVTTVGPFVRWGGAALDAAIGAGAHYIDSTGEPQLHPSRLRAGGSARQGRPAAAC